MNITIKNYFENSEKKIETVEALNEYIQETAATFEDPWTDLMIFKKDFRGNYKNTVNIEEIPLNKLIFKSDPCGHVGELDISSRRVALQLPDLIQINIEEGANYLNFETAEEEPEIEIICEDIEGTIIKFEVYFTL